MTRYFTVMGLNKLTCFDHGERSNWNWVSRVCLNEMVPKSVRDAARQQIAGENGEKRDEKKRVR